jgi:hypothetical protein
MLTKSLLEQVLMTDEMKNYVKQKWSDELARTQQKV